jgi:hypothetical protein
MRRLAAVLATLVVVGFAVFTSPSKESAHAIPLRPTATVTTTVTTTVTQTITQTVTAPPQTVTQTVTTTVTPTQTAPPSPTPRIAVMLVNFSDDIRQPWTPAFIDSIYDGPPRSVSDYYTTVSWGQWSMSADVFGWYPLTVASSPCNLLAVQQQADAAAIADGVDLSAYTNKTYIFPHNASCNFGGSGDLPGTRSWINFTCQSLTNCASRPNIIHELGHNFGLNHSFLDAGNAFEAFSVMGCCTHALFPNVQRLQLGLIPQAQLVTLTASDTITIGPATSQSSLVYRVPISTGYLYLENRADMTIYDPVLSDFAAGNLLIRRQVADGRTFLFDGSPVVPDNGPNSKGLPVGQSITIENVTITNQAFDGIDNTVEVTIG